MGMRKTCAKARPGPPPGLVPAVCWRFAIACEIKSSLLRCWMLCTSTRTAAYAPCAPAVFVP